MASFDAFPTNWQLAFMGVDDFAGFAWDADFDCTQGWKVLDWEDEMRSAGVSVFSFDGFVNLYAAALSSDFALWPEEMDKGWINLGSDFQAPMRRQRRTALDQHAVLGPSGKHWIEVQRRSTHPFFKEAVNEPIYVSPRHASSGELLGCVETAARIWWVRCSEHPESAFERGLVSRLWDMTLNWMMRVAQALEERGVDLPDAVEAELAFPSGVFKETEYPAEGADAPLTFVLNGATLKVSCPPTYINAFRRATNDGDRRMVETLLAGFASMAGLKDRAFVATAAKTIAGDPLARFFHSFEADEPITIISARSEPAFRVVHALDRQRARLGLARDAGRDKPGPVPLADANALMQKAVEVLWSRIRSKLQAYDRADVIERCVSNLSAIEIDRMSWRRTAAAVLAIHSDAADVVAAGSAREVDRTVAALAYRTIAEMAICTCAVSAGAPIADIELDDLLGDVTVLLDCASESDALHYGFVTTPPVVHRNGTFVVRSEIMEEVFRPFRDAHGARQFAAHAGSYKSLFKDPTAKPGAGPDPAFIAAFEAEFGVSPDDLMDFNFRVSYLAHQAGAVSLRLTQSELAALFAKSAPSGDAAKAVGALSLGPRKRWDEKSPTNAKARDWWPWRFSRRLSLARRPLLRIDDGADPLFVVSPILLDLNMRYLLRAHGGDLPETLFDSGLKTWIGHATNVAGHAFNDAVAARLKAQGCEVDTEVAMTSLGGAGMHGDVDVMAWRPGSPIVYIVECKRLMMSRSVGEIGERLQEYSGSSKAGDARTPGDRHQDRITQLKAEPVVLAKRLGIAPEALEIRSALIFDGLVPMQFSRTCLARFNIVTDIDSLEPFPFD